MPIASALARAYFSNRPNRPNRHAVEAAEPTPTTEPEPEPETPAEWSKSYLDARADYEAAVDRYREGLRDPLGRDDFRRDY